MNKPLLVGDCNPLHLAGWGPLYPYPRLSAGGKLCQKILRLHPQEYLRRYDRANLCHVKWDMETARRRAAELAARPHPVIILFGGRVCRAFKVYSEPFYVRGRFIVFPLVNSLRRPWSQGARELARDMMRDAGAY